MADDTVEVVFGAQTGDFNSGVDEVKNKFGDLSEEITRAEELFKYLGERMLEVFALHEITDFVGKMSEVGEQIERMSAMTGLSDESVQTLGFALQKTGGDASSAGMMIARFERNVDSAASGSGAAFNAFQRLGISLKEIQTLSIDQLIERTATAFRDIVDPVERAALASQVGSRGWAQMLPALLSSAAGLEAFHQRLVELNDELSGNTVKGLAETHGRFVDLGKAAEGAGIQGMMTFKGSIDGVLDGLTYAVVDIGKAITSLRELQVTLGTDLIIACGLFSRAIQDLGAIAGHAADEIVIRWKEVGAILTEVGTLNWSKIGDVQAEANAEIADSAKRAVTAMSSYSKEFDNLQLSANKAAAAIIAADNATEKAAAGEGASRHGAGAKDKADAADLSSISTKESIAKAHLATQIAILQQETAYHQITKQQEVEQEKAAVDAEYAIDMRALSQKASLYQQGGDNYKKALDQMDVLDAQHVAKIAQLDVKMATANDQAAKQMYKSWLGALQPVETAFDGMLNGILNGTETVSQAMASAFGNAAVSIVESLAKILAEWLVFEAATAISGKPATWSDFMALQTGSGGSGGFLGNILSFDVGTSSVPSTGLAMIHQGEMILPPDISAQVRGGDAVIGAGGFGSGGGSSQSVVVNFNVSAIDGQSAASFIKSQAPAIAQVVATQIRNGNSSLSRAAA